LSLCSSTFSTGSSTVLIIEEAWRRATITIKQRLQFDEH
jgi:hypothetical protein